MMKNRGFTLLELMVVVVVVSILATIAVSTYQNQIKKADAAMVEQELLKLADQLERYKSRNFSYHGFDPKYLYGQTEPMNNVELPRNKPKKYVVQLYDTSAQSATDAKTLLSTGNGLGKRWTMIAWSENNQNFHYFINSSGVRCKNKTKANMTYIGCGTSDAGKETW